MFPLEVQVHDRPSENGHHHHLGCGSSFRWVSIKKKKKHHFISSWAKAKLRVIDPYDTIQWYLYFDTDLPDLMVLQTVQRKYRVETIFFTQCSPSWGHQSEVTFTIVKLVLLYTAPLLFMSVAYWQIVRVLWRSDIPGHNCKWPPHSISSKINSTRTRNWTRTLLDLFRSFYFSSSVVPMYDKSDERYSSEKSGEPKTPISAIKKSYGRVYCCISYRFILLQKPTWDNFFFLFFFIKGTDIEWR